MGSPHMPPFCFLTHEPKLVQNSCLKPNCSCSVISPVLSKCYLLPTKMWAKLLVPTLTPVPPN